MNIVDQYDALRAKRPYKSSLDHEATVRIIMEGNGRTFPEHFDPNLRKVFIELAPVFKGIFETLEG
jgi:putative two-component system response regulator